MKKVLALVLVVLMVFGMGIQAFAQENTLAQWDRILPDVAESSSGLVIFYAMDDLLSEEDKKLMKEAQEKLDEVHEEHLALRYFCMVEIVGSESSLEIKFAPIEHDQIKFEQYVDGVWNLLDHTVNADGTISVAGIVNGPIAILTNDTDGEQSGDSVIPGKHASVGATKDKLLPGISKRSSSLVLLHSAEMVPHLSEEIQNLMAEAKAKLKDACPQGCAAKFFCYVEIIGDAETATVDFEKIDFNEIHFDQYVDGEWVELPYEVNEDGTITVKDVKEGPKVIFIR